MDAFERAVIRATIATLQGLEQQIAEEPRERVVELPTLTDRQRLAVDVTFRVVEEPSEAR